MLVEQIEQALVSRGIRDEDNRHCQHPAQAGFNL
jgi:hypothetical protein